LRRRASASATPHRFLPFFGAPFEALLAASWPPTASAGGGGLAAPTPLSRRRLPEFAATYGPFSLVKIRLFFFFGICILTCAAAHYFYFLLFLSPSRRSSAFDAF